MHWRHAGTDVERIADAVADHDLGIRDRGDAVGLEHRAEHRARGIERNTSMVTFSPSLVTLPLARPAKPLRTSVAITTRSPSLKTSWPSRMSVPVPSAEPTNFLLGYAI